MFYAAVYGLYAERGLPMLALIHTCDGWENMTALRLYIQGAVKEASRNYDAVLIVSEDDTVGILSPAQARNGFDTEPHGLKL